MSKKITAPEGADTTTAPDAQVNPQGQLIGAAPMNATELANVLGDRLGDAPLQSATDKARDEKAEEAERHERMVSEAFEDVDARVSEMFTAAITPAEAAALLTSLRTATIDADSEAEMSGAEYADLLGRVFDPMWPTWERKDVATGGNLAPVMAAFFTEKDAYYSNYRTLRARFSKRPNPRVSWKRFEDYQMAALKRAQLAKLQAEAEARGETFVAPTESTTRTTRTPEEATAKAVKPLYLKANKAWGADSTNMALFTLAETLHDVLKLVLSESELQALAEKVGA